MSKNVVRISPFSFSAEYNGVFSLPSRIHYRLQQTEFCISDVVIFITIGINLVWFTYMAYKL